MKTTLMVLSLIVWGLGAWAFWVNADHAALYMALTAIYVRQGINFME